MHARVHVCVCVCMCVCVENGVYNGIVVSYLQWVPREETISHSMDGCFILTVL